MGVQINTCGVCGARLKKEEMKDYRDNLSSIFLSPRRCKRCQKTQPLKEEVNYFRIWNNTDVT